MNKGGFGWRRLSGGIGGEVTHLARNRDSADSIRSAAQDWAHVRHQVGAAKAF